MNKISQLRGSAKRYITWYRKYYKFAIIQNKVAPTVEEKPQTCFIHRTESWNRKVLKHPFSSIYIDNLIPPVKLISNLCITDINCVTHITNFIGEFPYNCNYFSKRHFGVWCDSQNFSLRRAQKKSEVLAFNYRRYFIQKRYLKLTRNTMVWVAEWDMNNSQVRILNHQ